jgi:hypothetical protein
MLKFLESFFLILEQELVNACLNKSLSAYFLNGSAGISLEYAFGYNLRD